MRAIEIKNDGFHLTERPKPVPLAGQVLIRVAYAGMNRADRLQIKGLHPPPPGTTDIPGLEVSGVIEATGEAVCALLPGGGYAEFVAADKDLCLPVPKPLSLEQAGVLPEAAFTIWNNVFVRGSLKSGETLLVHGGTSGIGTLAIQMALSMGAKVLATCSSDDRAAFCEKLGAKAVNRNTVSFVDAFRATPPNVVLDMAGGKTLSDDIGLMALDGRHVSIAYLESQKAEIDIAAVMKKRLVITGSTLRGRPLAEQRSLAEGLKAHIWPLIEKGQITPVIDQVFPLEKAQKALEYFSSGIHIGKIVLKN
ncbi:MAG: NAD(P)H-quinone oxidoreductase [Proteobacteria bacterium]|nr:NAD(P)H-quinone oxidoreductase [Pseudomonadota bacterium]